MIISIRLQKPYKTYSPGEEMNFMSPTEHIFAIDINSEESLQDAVKQGVPITDIVRTALEHHASWVALNK
jgi:hypothetical protein